MISGLDLLGTQDKEVDTQSKKTGLDLLKPSQETKTGLDLLDQPPTTLPETPPTTDVSSLDEAFKRKPDRKPTGIFLEDLTEALKPSTEEFSGLETKPILKSIGGAIKSAAKKTGKELLATAELAMTLADGMLLFIPSKLYGAMSILSGAPGETSTSLSKTSDLTTLPSGLAGGSLVSVLPKLYHVATLPYAREVAEIAEEEMSKLGYHPYTKEGKAAADLIGKGFNLFLQPAHKIDEVISKLSPAAGYLVGFGAELAEFALTGNIIEGAKARFKPTLRQTVKFIEARRKMRQRMADVLEEHVRDIPDESIRKAQQKILELEKTRADLEAKEAMEKIDHEKAVKEDLKTKAEEVKEIKQSEEKASTKPVSKPKKKKAKKKPRKKTKVKKPKEPEPEPIPTEPSEPPEPAERPMIELDTDKSPFREHDPTVTSAMKKVYEQRIKSVMEDPELFTGKLINDVNRWLDGDDSVDINKVRNGLSELATRANELRADFAVSSDYPSNFIQWKELVSDAAAWARKADRLKIKQTDKAPEIQLNMMIPVDQIPPAVHNAMREIKKFRDIWNKEKRTVLAKDLYRNRELFRKTGFWLGKDGRWRYEIDSNKTKYRYYKLALATQFGSKGLPIHEVLEHPDLYKIFPEARDVRIKIYEGFVKNEASYNPNDNTIRIGPNTKKHAVLHELQHWVNDKMGLSSGTSIGYQMLRLKAERVLDILKKMKPLARTESVAKSIDKAISEVKKDLAKGSYRDWSSWLSGTFAEKASELGDLEVARYAKLPPGVSRVDAYREYLKDVGEMEARLTEARSYLSPEARKSIPPWETLDKMLKKEKLSPKEGVRLYSGIPVDKAAKALIKGADDFARYLKESRAYKSFKPLTALKLSKEWFVRKWLDRSGNIRTELLDRLGQAGYDVVQEMYLSSGSPAQAAEMLEQMRKEVYGGLSKVEKEILDGVILARRMFDIARYKTKFKFPNYISSDGKIPDKIAAWYEFYKDRYKLTDKQVAKIENAAKAYFEWMKKPLKALLDAELITKEEYDLLVSHNYRRIKLIDIFDKRYEAKIGKRKRTVYDSGIETLAKGRRTDIFEPSSEVMALEVFNRAYGRILNNYANRALLDVARRFPDNPFVRVREKGKIPSGWSRIFVYEKGQRKAIYLSPEMSKEWIVNNPEMSYHLSQVIRLASMSPILRTMATGINWGFALANLPRDIMHAWFTARHWEGGKWRSVYSPIAPVFTAQMLRDQLAVFNDAVLRRGRYKDYINEGGGMEFLVHQGRILRRGRHLEGPIDKINDFFGYFGETSEIMTRLAIRERMLRKGKTPREATFVARDYLDFGQGGSHAKVIDNGAPYLNAGIQAARGIARAFKPGSGTALVSMVKLAQFAALVVGLYIAMKKMCPKTAKELKYDINAQNNLVVPFGDDFGFEDEKGQMRYPYLKVPLDPSSRFFKKFFEAATDKWLGEEIDIEGTINALEQVSPVGISSLPPSLNGLIGYVTNKNFWLNEDIWQRTDKPFEYQLPKWLTGKPVGGSEEEYIPGKTPQAYIDFGKLTGLSPERTKYVVERLVTSGTVWSYLLGQGYEAAFGQLPKEKKKQHLAMTLAKMPIIRRFFGVTNPYTQFSRSIDKAKEKSDIDRWVQNSVLDVLIEGYLYHGTVKKKEISDYIKSFKDKHVQDRLISRFKFQETIKDLPHRSFWLRLRGLTPEARARVYVDRLNNSTEEERKQLKKELSTVFMAGGVVSDRFMQEVKKLQ